MKVKTSELTGSALDWAVAKCEGHDVAIRYTGEVYLVDRPWADRQRVKWLAPFKPSSAWAQGGPIIEREGLELSGFSAKWKSRTYWSTSVSGGPKRYWDMTGSTPLIAAMRCYVASKLGDEIDIPEELA